MQHTTAKRISWREALARERPLLLPVAHDALTARLIARAGFTAYQIGGFALSAALHATPDVDLEHFGEKSAAARNIMGASPLPVMVDGDDGYGDTKNVTRTVQDYELMGASAVFLEDQVAPKRCGHMAGKRVVPVEAMEGKVRAAVAARTKALQDALTDLKAGQEITNSNSVDMDEFEKIVDLPYWAAIEKRFGGQEQ